MNALRKIIFIAGLGNPGAEYENTYHNIGASALDVLRAKRGSGGNMKRVRNLFEYSKTSACICVKPLVFMNESGLAIERAMRFFKTKPEHMLVLHDDSDMEIGKFKISFGRGSAGHKGVESIIGKLGTKKFARVRIGIRPRETSGGRRKQASEFVLRTVSPEDRDQFAAVYERIERALETALP